MASFTGLAGLPTPTMDWSATDAVRALSKFKEMCTLIFNGPLADICEERQVNFLLLWVGEEGRELATSWNLPDAERKLLKSYWDRYERFVKPKSNFRIARFKLRGAKQAEGENVDQFVKRIRLIANECAYHADQIDEHLIDTLIFGCSSERIKSKLLQKDENLTLDVALDIARTEEATQAQLRDLQGERQVQTDAVHVKLKQSNGQTRSRQGMPTRQQSPDSKTYVCNNCGTYHVKDACPARGSKCLQCGKLNHWKRVCRSTVARHKTKGLHHVQVEPHNYADDPDTDSALYFDMIEIHTVEHDKRDTQALVNLTVASTYKSLNLTCKLDTGAEGNIISLATYKLIAPDSDFDRNGIPCRLQPSSTRITAYGGTRILQYGTCELMLNHRGKRQSATFFVVQTNGPLIIGLPTCRSLGLVTLNYAISTEHQAITNDKHWTIIGDEDAKLKILREYNDVFQGIGCLEGEYHITVDPSIPPVIHPPRRVPVALQEPLKEELDSLTAKGILSPVKEPTDWVNSCVCVTKPNGKIRLCLDPKDLNRAIKRPYRYMPTLDDVLPKLSGAKFFTILDARSGYWNVKLDRASSLLTTFNTPFGRYCYNRLPFGLSSAQDVFQERVDNIFGDVPGCTGIADDLIIAGWKEDGSDHDATLKTVLERARSSGLRFNDDKMVVRCKEIPFFGHIIGENGIRPDPSKVQAITAMTEPEDIKELQTFLGMTNYLSRFTPRLSSLSAPLHDLCKKDSDFQWHPEHTTAFNHIKDEISRVTNLQFYDRGKPVTIQVDASMRGLGVAMLQDGRPVAFASKALTETERRYSNIEREMLGIVFGLERFHHYVFGRLVTIETDHKPLESISQKNLHSAPPRLARMLLRLQQYQVTVKYVPGKDIPLADALSRITPMPSSTIKGLDITVHELYSQLNASTTRLTQIREETAKDDTLAILRDIIAQGWPERRKDCPECLHGYWNYRDELGIEDGIILKGSRIVIPQSLRAEVLEQLHYAHQGIEKCRLRAKSSVFWDCINRDIEKKIERCSHCQTHQASATNEPLMPQDVPPRAWHTLSSDLFYWEQKHYLLVADLFSKFPIVRKLDSISSRAIISHLKGIFEEHGIPERLLSDNGTQYSSEEFRMFAATYGFEHVTSSPAYPRSNGFIERMVQTVKHIFTKARESGQDPHLAMLCLRTTPIDHHTPSPCELLNRRMYRSNLPAASVTKMKEMPESYNDSLQRRQDLQKSFHDRSVKALPQLKPHDHVRVQDPHSKLWHPGQVIQKTSAPRSYIVQTSAGTYRRNRRHLRHTSEQFLPHTLQEDHGEVEDPTTQPSTAAVPFNQSEQECEDIVRSEALPSDPTTETSVPLRRSGRIRKPPVRMNL